MKTFQPTRRITLYSMTCTPRSLRHLLGHRPVRRTLHIAPHTGYITRLRYELGGF